MAHKSGASLTRVEQPPEAEDAPSSASLPRSAPAAAPDAAPAPPWVLYLIECAGERLYAGITNDLPARFQAHRDGRGARFTRAFPPVRIVAASKLPSRSAALKAEYALKQQARSLKLRFLAGCGTPLDAAELASPPRRRR
jgi:putative endonuclease